MFETLRNLGAGRLMVMGLVAIGLVAFFVYLTSRLTAPTMGLLYAGLDPAEAGRIVGQLEGRGVPVEIRANGSQILVPQDQVARLRMIVAQEGLPSGGTMGYEIFDKSDSLGTSNFVLNVQHLRALEGELSRSIQSIHHVRRARVHLVLPRRQLFSREAPEASASVILEMQGGRRLDSSEVAAVQQLVAGAVPNLQPGQISIIDGHGTLLARARGNNENDAPGLEEESRRQTLERNLARTVEEMLERTVGPGRVRAEVRAEMDFDRIQTTTESFDPDGQVVRSTQTVEEVAESREAQANGVVTIENDLPQGNANANNNQSGTRSNRTEETVNFEISRTTRTHLQVAGAVRRLSAAVLIDGTYTDDGSGQRVYVPRSEAELAEFRRLVETAIGFNQARGDQVEVINLRFAQGEIMIEEEPRPMFGMGKNDYLRIAEILILGIVAILVILLVIRPLVKRVLDSLPDALASSRSLIGESAAAISGAGTMAALPGAAHGALPSASGAGGGSSLDLAAIEGRVRESSAAQIGEIVEKHPEEAVSIIRNWMYQGT